MITKANIFVRCWNFYVEGFKSMTWGRALWIIIILKLFVMFAILRVFFFRPALEGKTEEQKQEAVGEQLAKRPLPEPAAGAR